MVYLTRKEHFNAAHRLHNPEWSAEKNREVFGKCNNENWHGHNFDLYVTVKGEPDPQTGFVYNAKELSRVIQERVVNKLDHQNLNLDVDFLQGIMPTTENLAKAIWQQLAPALDGCELYSIQLWETDRIYVNYYGH